MTVAGMGSINGQSQHNMTTINYYQVIQLIARMFPLAESDIIAVPPDSSLFEERTWKDLCASVGGENELMKLFNVSWEGDNEQGFAK